MAQRQAHIAKITRPILPDVYPRQRLFRVLDENRAPIVWISGPPGSGKTTLVANWLDFRKLPCLWYQVDEGDSDIATFFYYTGLAAKKAAPRIKKPLPLLTPEYQFGIPTFTRRYFEDFFSRMKPPHVIVFDNYQQVSAESPCHEVMLNGLSEIPEGIKVIVISRTDPPEVFARLEANKIMDVIGWEQLRLTPEETSGMMKLRTGKPVSKELQKKLYEKTSGWAAGVVLMESSQAGGGGQIEREAMVPGKLSDYFAGEIFNNIDEEMQDFLLKTAYFPRMTPRMAEAITVNSRAGQILSELNRRNYFTERRLEPEITYQYHAMFREFLQKRAEHEYPEAARTQLRFAAAKLLEEAGQIEDVASIYMETGYLDGLARIIATTAPQLMKQGRIRTIEHWLGALPPDVVETSPWLLYWTGVCRFPFSYTEGRTYFEKAFRRFDAQGDVVGSILAWCGIIDTISYEYGNLKQLDQWIAWFSSFVKKQPAYPSIEIEFRAVTSMMIALLLSHRRHEDIHPWVERAMELVHKCPDVNARILSSIYMALFYFCTGEPEKIRRIVRDQKTWGKSAEATPLSLAGIKYGETLHQWIAGIGDCGIRAAIEGLEVSAAHGIHMADHHLIARALFGALSTGDLALSGELFDRLESVTGSMQLHMNQYHYLHAWYLLLKGDFTKSYQQALASLKVSEEAGSSVFHLAYGNIAAAQALVCQGAYEKAKKHITAVFMVAKEIRGAMIEFNGLLIQAQLFLSESGNNAGPRFERGLEYLRKALTLGRERGYLNTFLWYAPAMTSLCTTALEAGIEVEYVRDLIRKRNLVADAPPQHIDTWPWSFRILTLGKFEVRKDDKSLAVSKKVQKKPLQLLKALIALGGKDVREDRLADLLWPDAEGDAGQKAVNVNTVRLRRLLGTADAIVVKEGRVSLDPRLCWVDVWAFERMLDSSPDESFRGQAAFGVRSSELKGEKKKSAATIAMLEKAVDLYKGPFLAHDHEPWAVPLREKLRDKFLRSIDALGGHLEQSGKYKEALQVYQRGLDVDDLAEIYYQRMMNCYIRLGRRAEALSVYNRCKKILATYGVELAQETEALRGSLRLQG